MLLEILSLNLWGLPWPFACDRKARKLRFREHVSTSQYHLIGIQELWWPWRRTFELESLAVPSSSRDCGLALAGSLRAAGPLRVRHFRHHAGPDRLKRKGVLSTHVELNGGTAVAVHVTHLQAGHTKSAVRSRQIDELLDEIGRDDSAAVLMGDFNFHGRDAVDAGSDARLRDAGFADAACDAAAPTFTSRNRYVRHRHVHERFDRVFVRSGRGVCLRPVDAEVLDRITPLSDHHPVRVRVKVEG